LLLAMAHRKFDAQLRLTDEAARTVLATLLERFARWILRERAATAADRAAADAVSPDPAAR
jgi:hypothetical protein